HRFLPRFFHPDEIADRDANFAAVAARSELVILSSHAAARDFAAVFPALAWKARVAPFPSIFAFDLPGGGGEGPREVAARYRLPDKFALVVNQLWAHKNHGLVVEAAARAASRGRSIPVAMVGAPFDYRDRRGRYLSGLLQQIASAGLSGQVTIL